jgi:hypothetical protein
MAEPSQRRPPLPLVQAFLACHDIFIDGRTGVHILVGPTSHVPATQFPTFVRLSFVVETVGGHGAYLPRLTLTDDTDEAVWGWTAPEPFESPDPLFPHLVTFHNLAVAVPRPGRYALTLLLNGQETARRGMWFGPAPPARVARADGHGSPE